MTKRRAVPSPAATTAPPRYRCRVEVAVLSRAPAFSQRLSPGSLVDLDARVAEGVTLRDLVREDWFEPMPADPPAGLADHETQAPPDTGDAVEEA